MRNQVEYSRSYDSVRFWPLLLLAFLAAILAQGIHETGHHVVYQLAGHDPVWAFTKLVQVWETEPVRPEEWVRISGPEGEAGWLKLSSLPEGGAETAIAAAAGPAAGLLGALLGLALARWGRRQAWKQIGLALSLSSSLAAVLYYLRSPLRSGGDEYDVALQLGVGKEAVEIPLALAFAVLLFLALRELPGWRVRLKWLGVVLLGSVAAGVPMALADPYLIDRVDAGASLFGPILGYSAPVFAVLVLALAGLWFWGRWMGRGDSRYEPGQ